MGIPAKFFVMLVLEKISEKFCFQLYFYRNYKKKLIFPTCLIVRFKGFNAIF